MNKEINSTAVAAAFDQVFQFNDMAGQFKSEPLQSVNLQLDLIFEEFCDETIKAFERGCNAIEYDKDKQEAGKQSVALLDGVCDTFVVVAGLMQKLQNAGFDVEQALLRVTENNLSKFTTKADYNWASNQGYEVVFDEKYYRFSYRDANGKARKPPEYVSVNIDDLANKDFFNGVGQ